MIMQEQVAIKKTRLSFVDVVFSGKEIIAWVKLTNCVRACSSNVRATNQLARSKYGQLSKNIEQRRDKNDFREIICIEERNLASEFGRRKTLP